MKTISSLLLLAILLISCKPLQTTKNVAHHIPSIGAIGKVEKSLLASHFYKIGNPSITTPIALTLREVPFTKTTFKKYVEVMHRSGEVPGTVYSDSLANKPKYLSIELLDKIGLKAVLNNEVNQNVRSYLQSDKDYTVVSRISLLTTPEETELLSEADGIFLVQDHHGMPVIQLVNENTERLLPLPQTDIFDYQLSGFCWGKNRYGQLQIVAIPSNSGSCPRGTEEKAYKLNETKSYLKL